MNDEMEKALVGPITSRSDLLRCAHKFGLTFHQAADQVPQLSPDMRMTVGTPEATNDDTLWPLRRDMMREQQGIYPPPTAVLLWLRTFKHIAQMFPHVSREDKTMIAFTADLESAVKDKKVRMGMGRFLKKFFPLYTDNVIRELEASHRAELDDTLEVVTGIEGVQDVYTHMVGDSGCMRHSLGHFGHRKYHPSAVYASPGFGVAVTRDASGKVKSRSVVWVNPADDRDKRYVRIYGDVALQKKLTRAGYRLRGLKGAKFLALREPHWSGEPDRFVMPYIDPAGGIHYSGSKEAGYDARYAVRYADDPEFIHLVTNEERGKLIRLGVACVDTTTQGGSLVIPVSSHAQIMCRCEVTGENFSRLDHASVQWLMPDGTLSWAKATAINPRAGHVAKQIGISTGMVVVYGPQERFEGRMLPAPYETYVRNDLTMRHLGIAYLQESRYGQNVVVPMREAVQTADGWVRNKEAYRVEEPQEEGGFTSRYIHKDDVKMLRKMGYVSVAPLFGMKLLVHKNDTRLVTTAGDKKALTGVHDLATLWDGRQDFPRNVVMVAVGAFSVAALRGDPSSQRRATVPQHMLQTRIFGGSDLMTLSDPHAQRQFIRYFGRFLHKVDGQIVDAGYSSNGTVDNIVAAARDIVAMTEEQVNDLHYSMTTMGWAASVMRCVAMSEAAYQRGVELAERCAEECWVQQSEPALPEHQRVEMESVLDSLLQGPPVTFMRTPYSSLLTTTTSTATATLNPAAAWPMPLTNGDNHD